MSVTAASRQSAPSTNRSSGMLHKGSKGPEVLKLQKALAAAGFNPQGLDGSFGGADFVSSGEAGRDKPIAHNRHREFRYEFDIPLAAKWLHKCRPNIGKLRLSKEQIEIQPNEWIAAPKPGRFEVALVVEVECR